jgi:hypothetical protein
VSPRRLASLSGQLDSRICRFHLKDADELYGSTGGQP